MNVAADRDAAAAPDGAIRPDFDVVAHLDEARLSVDVVYLQVGAVVEEDVFPGRNIARPPDDYARGVVHAGQAAALHFVIDCVRDDAAQRSGDSLELFGDEHVLSVP